MKYGVICVYDSGRPGAANNSRWVKRKIGDAEERAEFDSDAEARAYIRETLLPRTGVSAQIESLKENGVTSRTAPAAHWVFYPSPIPASEQESVAQQEQRRRYGRTPQRSSRRGDNQGAQEDGCETPLL